MKKYKPYLTRVDLVKNQVERERIQEQEAAKKRKQRAKQQNHERWLRYQEQLRSELAARYFHGVVSAGGETFSNTKSLSFDGNDDYVDCGNIPEIKNNTEMTLSFWAKIEDITFRILFGQNLVAGNDIFQLYLWGATPALYIWIKNGGTGTVSFVDNATLTSLVSVGVWNHFTLVFNGSLSNADRCKLFINGGGDAITNRGTMPTAFPNSDEPFLIGRGTNGYFQGNIDEVAVWNSDQSANVSTIYNGGEPNDISSLSPVSYYRFEGTGATATDSGTGGNDGTINGATRDTDVPS